MTGGTLIWPAEDISEDAAARWVTSIRGRDAGPAEILQVKRWGVTARFRDVVLKASFTPLFPQVTGVHTILERALPGATPRLLASETVRGQLWTLFEHVLGPTAEEAGTTAALVATARELARVQAAVAEQDLSQIPATDVRSLPRLLLDDIDDQPEELVAWLRDAQPALQADADELAEFPSSLDHPDVNPTNAILTDGGRAVLLDWEEATVGCPLFSLDRLLHDARGQGVVELVTDAYLDALPWGDREALDRAMRLVPLKLAIEARAFARGLGLPHPHTHLTARMIEEARARYA